MPQPRDYRPHPQRARPEICSGLGGAQTVRAAAPASRGGIKPNVLFRRLELFAASDLILLWGGGSSFTRSIRLATARYRAGIDPYLNVITAQTTLLSNQQTAVSLRRQQITASVQLVEALGGSWNVSDLPSATQVAGRGR